MKYEELMTCPAEEVWTQNQAMLRQSREHAALIGAVWSAIERRNLWKEWDFETMEQAITEVGPRAYSTVTECIRNFRIFVESQRMTFAEYCGLLLEHGIRKVSLMGQVVHYAGEKPIDINALSGRVKPLSISQAKKALRGPRLYRVVHRHYIWSEDFDGLVQEAIAHIQSRVIDMRTREHVPVPPSYALGLMAGEYVATKAMRKPIMVPAARQAA